ncbi:zinc ribbon domain-containing protein [Actinomadura sp. 9N407]|uniref:zinc ribbon domain-containing protein n=1 Tax=Actinomadura sp. 9N407 TaxID=3375154 RepID=UPI0037B556D5
MKAAQHAQQRLVDLQDLDTTLDRLAHRRRTLPELAEVDRLRSRLTELRDAIVGAETEVGDLDREQRKAEQDVDQVRARADRDQKRLDSGQVTSAKDLSGLQAEIGSLQRRQSDLEEVVLEIMERREETEGRVTTLRTDRAAAQEELDAVVQRRDTAQKEIDEESAATGAARTAVAKDVPEDLLNLYEKLRGQFDGVGAAKLYRGACQGCHLALNTVDLNRIRAAADDEVIRCEECRRILVRTPESGL